MKRKWSARCGIVSSMASADEELMQRLIRRRWSSGDGADGRTVQRCTQQNKNDFIITSHRPKEITQLSLKKTGDARRPFATSNFRFNGSNKFTLNDLHEAKSAESIDSGIPRPICMAKQNSMRFPRPIHSGTPLAETNFDLFVSEARISTRCDGCANISTARVSRFAIDLVPELFASFFSLHFGQQKRRKNLRESNGAYADQTP